MWCARLVTRIPCWGVVRNSRCPGIAGLSGHHDSVFQCTHTHHKKNTHVVFRYTLISSLIPHIHVYVHVKTSCTLYTYTYDAHTCTCKLTHRSNLGEFKLNIMKSTKVQTLGVCESVCAYEPLCHVWATCAWKMTTVRTYGHMTKGVLDLCNKAISEKTPQIFDLRCSLSMWNQF